MTSCRWRRTVKPPETGPCVIDLDHVTTCDFRSLASTDTLRAPNHLSTLTWTTNDEFPRRLRGWSSSSSSFRWTSRGLLVNDVSMHVTSLCQVSPAARIWSDGNSQRSNGNLTVNLMQRIWPTNTIFTAVNCLLAANRQVFLCNILFVHFVLFNDTFYIFSLNPSAFSISILSNEIFSSNF